MPLGPSAYLTGAAAGLLAKGIMLVAGMSNLWLLNRILSKAEFGTYSFVMAFVFLLATAGTGGLERTLLYRVSRLEAEPGRLAGGDFAAAVMRAVVLFSAALAAVIVACSYFVSDLGHLPHLEFWMVVLARRCRCSASARSSKPGTGRASVWRRRCWYRARTTSSA